MANYSGNYTMPPATTYPRGFYNNFTKPDFTFSLPTIPPGYKNWDVPSEPTAQIPIKDSVYILVLHIILFIICLSENTITLFILYSNIKAGKQTFAQFMLVNIACVDILTSLTYYPAIFVKFTHGGFVWLAQGLAGDVLCTLYNFLLHLPEKVLILTLVSLACDAARNSSPKGRREHSKKFSLIVVVLFWVTASGFSAIYFRISKLVQPKMKYQAYMCSTEQDSRITVTILNFIHSFVFVVTADAILTIVDVVVFIKVRRRLKEMNKNKQDKDKTQSRVRMRRKRGINLKKDNKVYDGLSESIADVGQEMQAITSSGNGVHVETVGHSDSSSISPVASKGNKEKHDVVATEKDTNASLVRKSRKTVGSQKKGRGKQFHNRRDEETQDIRQHTQERFKTTQIEAKIMGAISSLFVIISLTQLVLQMVCSPCSVYLLFAVEIAAELYTVIKPGIYAIIDKEFRKKYKQFSPIACCCFRRAGFQLAQQKRETHPTIT